MALARQWDDLITQVRALPGFAEFARPPNAATLTRAVTGGTVIIVNVSLWRCDALLITAGRIRVVPLPGLTIDGAVGCAMTYLNALLRFEEARGDPKTAQGRAGAGTHRDTRMAMGPHRRACTRCLRPDICTRSPAQEPGVVVSNRATRFVAAARRRPSRPGRPAGWPQRPGQGDLLLHSHASSTEPIASRPVPDRPGRMLLITLPDTPGQPALPYVSEEQALLSSIFTDTQRTDLAGAAATRGAIMAGLAAHNWAHIACHGTQNLGDPSTGGLVPYDWLTEGFVTVTDIAPAAALMATLYSWPHARRPQRAPLTSTKSLRWQPDSTTQAGATSSPPCGPSGTTLQPTSAANSTPGLFTTAASIRRAQPKPYITRSSNAAQVPPPTQPVGPVYTYWPLI